MSRIVLPTACEFRRHARVAIWEILFHEAINSISQFICCIAQTVVISLLEAAGPIQFCDMILAGTPRASLSNQSPVALMAPPEWRLVTMVSSTLPVAIQRRSSVKVRKEEGHAERSSTEECAVMQRKASKSYTHLRY